MFIELVVTKFSTHATRMCMRTSGKSQVCSRAWPAGKLKDRSAPTCQQRRKDVSLSLQLLASSTPRYGTHVHKSRWKISPWLLTTVSSRSWIADVYAHGARLHHPGWRGAAYYGRSPVQRTGTGLVDTNIKTTKLILKAFFDFSRNLAPPKITRYTVSTAEPQNTYSRKICWRFRPKQKYIGGF